MSKYLLIVLIILSFSALPAQNTKTLVVNEKLGTYNGVEYWVSRIHISSSYYKIEITFKTDEISHIGSINSIYTNDNANITINGYKLGQEIKGIWSSSSSQKKESIRFTAQLPRTSKTVLFEGLGRYDKKGSFDLSKFNSFIPKQVSIVKKISGSIYSTVQANVRKGAGTNFTKMGKLKIGDKLTLKEETEKWYRFSSSEFTDGWVAKSLTSKVPPIPVDDQKPKINLYNPELSDNLFRTEEFSAIIKGNATDNEGIFQVYINSETASLKSNGQFQKRIKLRIGKNPIEIRAIDINNNETTKEFLIIRDEIIEEDEFSDIDFALETSNNKPNAIAVVLGIEEYQYAPNVTNAYNDAEIMREYLISTFGLKRENIYFRYNERATKGEFEKVFSENGWISKNADKNSEIYVFYAGHGVASTDDKSAYLIPNDIDPNYATTGYSLNDLYQNLSKIESKSTTIILDACFSGISKENEMLLADSRPVSIKVKEGSIPKNLNVFTASSGSEISSGYSQKLHGLFTYFFLKGLNKNADLNNDKKITYGEMENYLKENVSSQARKMGREQNPQLHTDDKSKILLKY